MDLQPYRSWDPWQPRSPWSPRGPTQTPRSDAGVGGTLHYKDWMRHWIWLSLLLHSWYGLRRVGRHLPPRELGTSSASQGGQRHVVLPGFQATLESVPDVDQKVLPEKTQSKFYSQSEDPRALAWSPTALQMKGKENADECLLWALLG